MRLERYINESLSDRTKEQLKDYIAKNCQPFLKEFGTHYAHMHFIYRGLKTRNIKTFTKITPRTDRLPRLINKNLHTYLNKISKELFGWNARSEGVFTGSDIVAKAYGEVNIFIPYGNYKYVYINDSWDVYGLYDHYDYLSDEDEPYYEDMKEKAKTVLDEIYKIYKNDYKNSGLVNNLKEPHLEAIFKCKEYLVLNSTHAMDLVDILRELLKI